MRIDERISAIRQEALRQGKTPVSDAHKGVGKERLRRVLGALGLDNPDIVDAVFALLDDTRPSFFTRPPDGALFCDGATTAHVGCHVGILQRGTGKLDREGRDYWIKPLRDIGAIEACYLSAEQRTFLPGHPVAKSSNNCYRLDSHFVAVLQAHDDVLAEWIDDWSNSESTRARLKLQAAVAVEAATQITSEHADLIGACLHVYAKQFLPTYSVLFTDSADGDRVSAAEQVALKRAGVALGIDDPMPDLILWDEKSDQFWIIEAVTSDGEVDLHKQSAVQRWASRYAKYLAGCTTAYSTWKAAASRQGRYKNLAPNSYLWIREDPGRQFRVCVP